MIKIAFTVHSFLDDRDSPPLWYKIQFSYNPFELLEALPSEIKEIIFEKVIDYYTYPGSFGDTD